MRQLRKKESKQFFKEMRKERRRQRQIYLILENIQYARNVAGIFRTADAAGVRRIYLTGISHQPPFGKDLKKASRNKEKSVEWKYEKDTGKVLQTLQKQGFHTIALEITDEGIPIENLEELIEKEDKICIIVGNEVYGVTNSTLEKCDTSVYIPMYGRGGSLNVGVSAAIALYSF